MVLLSLKCKTRSHAFAKTCKNYVHCCNFVSTRKNNVFCRELANMRLTKEKRHFLRFPNACLLLPPCCTLWWLINPPLPTKPRPCHEVVSQHCPLKQNHIKLHTHDYHRHDHHHIRPDLIITITTSDQPTLRQAASASLRNWSESARSEQLSFWRDLILSWNNVSLRLIDKYSLCPKKSQLGSRDLKDSIQYFQ